MEDRLFGSRVTKQNASRTWNASFRENTMFYVVTVNCDVSVYYRVTENRLMFL